MASHHSRGKKPEIPDDEKDNRQETDADRITGIDLKIDESVHHLCEVYNTTSGSTRSVIYVLLVINLLSLMAVINTNPWNWTDTRIAVKKDTVSYDEKRQMVLIGQNKRQLDSLKAIFNAQQYLLKSVYKENVEPLKHKKAGIKKEENNDYKKDTIYRQDSAKYVQDSALYTRKYLLAKITDSDKTDGDMYDKNSLVRNKIENSQHVSIPLMGNSFDIDDLALVSGFSFIILLFVLRFMLMREKNNLRIAFISITERYTNDADDELMREAEVIAKREGKDADKFKTLINTKRKRYHYNFLSMNEIFNMPSLDVSSNKEQKTRVGKLVKNHIFSFPFIIYFIVVVNDILTCFKGFQVSTGHTLVSYTISLVCLTLIARICDSCNIQKNKINSHFDDFYYSGYTCNRVEYVRANENEKRLTRSRQIFYVSYFLKKMVIDFFKIILKKNEEPNKL